MKRILTCLDSSPRAAKVLAAAIDLAQKSGAKLVLFRGVGLPPDLHEDIFEVSPNQIVERLIVKARGELAELAKGVPQEMLEAQGVHVGTPWDVICREAKARECDLIVIGSHGYGGLDRVIGTTAAKVVNHADRSVLVVR
ncbi:MAG TPA: universal stress protein [Labilithrix sp.]|jgi:nucleotide-binding universal stress UspA family protein